MNFLVNFTRLVVALLNIEYHLIELVKLFSHPANSDLNPIFFTGFCNEVGSGAEICSDPNSVFKIWSDLDPDIKI